MAPRQEWLGFCSPAVAGCCIVAGSREAVDLAQGRRRLSQQRMTASRRGRHNIHLMVTVMGPTRCMSWRWHLKDRQSWSRRLLDRGSLSRNGAIYREEIRAQRWGGGEYVGNLKPHDSIHVDPVYTNTMYNHESQRSESIRINISLLSEPGDQTLCRENAPMETH